MKGGHRGLSLLRLDFNPCTKGLWETEARHQDRVTE